MGHNWDCLALFYDFWSLSWEEANIWEVTSRAGCWNHLELLNLYGCHLGSARIIGQSTYTWPPHATSQVEYPEESMKPGGNCMAFSDLSSEVHTASLSPYLISQSSYETAQIQGEEEPGFRPHDEERQGTLQKKTWDTDTVTVTFAKWSVPICLSALRSPPHPFSALLGVTGSKSLADHISKALLPSRFWLILNNGHTAKRLGRCWRKVKLGYTFPLSLCFGHRLPSVCWFRFSATQSLLFPAPSGQFLPCSPWPKSSCSLSALLILGCVWGWPCSV